MDQRQLTLLIAVIVAVVVVAVISFLLARKRRSQQLRARFGPEYDRVVNKEGEVRRAEGVLDMRAKRCARNLLCVRCPKPTAWILPNVGEPCKHNLSTNLRERWRRPTPW